MLRHSCGGEFHKTENGDFMCLKCGEEISKGVHDMKLQMQKNKDNAERVKADRAKDNANVKRSYRLGPRKK